MRWGYGLAAVLVAAVVLNAVLLASRWGQDWTIRPQPGFWWFAVAIVLTSPLQAAAEEYFFRGYLMQALSPIVRGPWFGIVASAALFAAFHGTQNLPLFLDRFGFGLLAGVLALKTGGLEAGIAAHVVNNICAFGYAGLTSTIAAVKATQVIGWADAGWDLAGFGLFALARSGWRGGWGLATTTPPEVPGLAGRWRRLVKSCVAGPHRVGATLSGHRTAIRSADPSGIVGYGVIGSPPDSGSVSLGSSPSTPAHEVSRRWLWFGNVRWVRLGEQLGPRCVAA